jgi:hypothetical protein
VSFALIPHAARPAPAGRAVQVEAARRDDGLHLLYTVDGGTGGLAIPASAAPDRADGLWQTTCLELFVRDDAGAYREFNFSPSTQWAAYHFTGRREGMTALPMQHPPHIMVRRTRETLVIAVTVPILLAQPTIIGLTAVIAEESGAKSFWALAHGGDVPDFHDPAGFVATI